MNAKLFAAALLAVPLAAEKAVRKGAAPGAR
jgi:hypothetical protein